ncbi:NUDIX domain-containing protein [Candidatus Uhrbacteria bacterium]|nr:NUDIX domain-containing protein [Candidatus Uhrbacteria bacterium]
MQTKTPNSKKPSSSSRTRKPTARSAKRKRIPPRKPSSKLGKPDVHRISAGGIIYRKKGEQIEIFFIKDPYGRWTFAKGKQELGETLAETAVREIQEETGLEGLRLVAPLGRTSFRFKREVGVVETTVYFFLFEAPTDAKPNFTGEGDIWHGAWMKAHKAFSISGYGNLDRLLAKAMRIINEQEGMKPDHIYLPPRKRKRPPRPNRTQRKDFK